MSSDEESCSSESEALHLDEVPVGIPLPKPTSRAVTEWEAPWMEQRECFLLLLRARMLFRRILEARLRDERTSKGVLNALEVHDLVVSQQENLNTDFVQQITELKRNLMTEVRKNRAMEKDVTTLDKKIGLLIHNAHAMEQILHKKKKRKDGEEPHDVIPLDKLQHYAHLFYTLQSEPHYLANLVGRMADQEGVESLLDTILITLYGDAYSPREEYLILTWFRLTVEQELKQLKSTSEFGPESLLAKAVLSYNRRKQGQEYLRLALGPTMLQFTGEIKKLRLDGRRIVEEIISSYEITEGKKSPLRGMSDDEVSNLPEVQATLKQKLGDLTNACQMFLDAIISSAGRVPYGLRFICRQLCELARERFPRSKSEEFYRMTSYLIYYRFINLAIVQPENFQIPMKMNDPETQMSLVEVSKVLHKLFTFGQFDRRTDRWYAPLNDWIATHVGVVRQYLDEVMSVDNPEEELHVDQYVELTQMVKPTILIAIHELVNVHRFLEENSKDLAPNPEDKLNILLKDLGKAVDYADEDAVISLTLENKFPISEESISETQQLFSQTKMALIGLLRQLPKNLPLAKNAAGEEPTLSDILKAGAKWAKDENNGAVREAIDNVRKNIETLEKLEAVTAADGHRALLSAITREIADRAQIQEQQDKEIQRLKLAIQTAVKQQQYLAEQFSQYNQYIMVCREHHYSKPKKGNKAKQQQGKILGPFKFTYSELVRKHVIADSTIPEIARKVMRLSITSGEPGVFDIEVKIPPGVEAATMRIELDDLLEAKSKSKETFTHTVESGAELTLDVNMTIHFLNTLLAKK